MENFWIMKHSDNMNLLNKKSELITKCEHVISLRIAISNMELVTDVVF